MVGLGFSAIRYAWSAHNLFFYLIIAYTIDLNNFERDFKREKKVDESTSIYEDSFIGSIYRIYRIQNFFIGSKNNPSLETLKTHV